jgi:hypothetical protein
MVKTQHFVVASAGIVFCGLAVAFCTRLADKIDGAANRDLQTDKARFRVIRARYVHGADLSFSIDNPIAEWGRQALDRFGIHLRGSRRLRPFSRGVPIHAIELLCEETLANEDLSGVDAQCITESGQIVHLTAWITQHCASGRIYFIFYYADNTINQLHMMGWADSDVTNFCPKRLCILRKSDHHELSNLELSR